MVGGRLGRRTSLVTALLFSFGALGVAEHQAQSPPPNAVGEEISKVGHSSPDHSLHLDAAVVKPPHACVVCWLGSAGLGVPSPATLLERPVSAPVPLSAAADPRSTLRDAPSSRGPPPA